MPIAGHHDRMLRFGLCKLLLIRSVELGCKIDFISCALVQRKLPRGHRSVKSGTSCKNHDRQNRGRVKGQVISGNLKGQSELRGGRRPKRRELFLRLRVKPLSDALVAAPPARSHGRERDVSATAGGTPMDWGRRVRYPFRACHSRILASSGAFPCRV
jgi:hypothetical protein